MIELTERQREILEFIESRLAETGYPPTQEDIVQAFGFASRNAARDHLHAIARKGYIEVAPNSARSIRVLANSRGGPPQQFELPLIGPIAAGTPVTAAVNIESRLRVDPRIFSPRADFLHRVAGKSMIEAGIEDGDIVAIHAQPEADNGQIVAAVLPDESTGEECITLKRYLRKGPLVTLKAENPSPRYKPIEVDLRHRGEDSQEGTVFRIAGIYVGLIRLPR